jgi:choline-sulfatase
MTGRYPSRNRVWNNSHLLSSGLSTWAHLLGTAGYETSLIGRMHFEGPDQYHGFEKRPVGEYWAAHPGAPLKGGKMWTHFSSKTCGQTRPAVEIAGFGTTHYQCMDRIITDAACDFLLGKRGNNNRPFAAVVGYVLPHCPFIAPKDLFDYYYERVNIPEIERTQPPAVARFRRLRKIDSPPLSEKQVRVALAAYYALCETMDTNVGQILQALDESGQTEETLLIYCSDHGEMAGSHGCWWKSIYYEESAAVPLVARWPGVTPSASVTEEICNLLDLPATFADIAGAGSVDMDGRSLVPFLRGERPGEWRNETFSEFVDERGGNLASRMIRSGRWKLWLHGDDEGLPPVMFDLENDPKELCDLGSDPVYADIRDKLVARVMENWNPALAAAESAQLTRDRDILTEWGGKLAPELPETLPVPPPEVEDDVCLL